MDLHPIQGGVAILLVALCYGNRVKLRGGGGGGGTRLANEIPPTANNDLSYVYTIYVNNNKFSFSSTSSSIVFSHLNKLCRSKATGLDNISAKIIRECADFISVLLCDPFNKSLVSGVFPDDWKCARVTPLFKQGDPSDLNIKLSTYFSHFRYS